MTVEKPSGLNVRVDRLEEWRNRTDTKMAVDFNERRHIDERFDRVETSISGVESSLMELKGAFNKVWWIIAGVILAGVARWLLAGGLAGG